MFRIRHVVVTIACLSLAGIAIAQMSPKSNKKFFDPSDGEMPFSRAVRVGDTLYLSGALAYRDGKLVEGGIEPETEATLEIIEERLAEYDLAMSDVVKCTVFLADMGDFQKMNAIYMAAFAPPRPTRSTVGVNGLALGAAIEIECIAVY